MVSYSVTDLGTFVLNPNATSSWQTLLNTPPTVFVWFSAQPIYPNETVELINHDNYMDGNGALHHNWSIKNGSTTSATVCKVVCIRAWP